MHNDEPIYEFPLFKDALRRRGIVVGETGGYRIVRPGDVVFKDGRGNVVFNDNNGNNGIFVIDSNGYYHQVFMYKRDYRLVKYGKPRYHLCNCEVIQDFINSGSFTQHYRYANTQQVEVLNMDKRFAEETIDNLPLCKYCANIMSQQYKTNMTSNRFVEILKEAGEATEQEKAEVDIFGYVRNWPKLSEAKRAMANYTCEQCGYHAENTFTRRFIQVHHIDGNKLNNNEENLKCLCIRCHANVDERHKQNFSRGANADILNEFIVNYA